MKTAVFNGGLKCFNFLVMDLLKSGLKKIVEASKAEESSEIQNKEKNSEHVYFKKFYSEWKQDRSEDPTYKLIPKFYQHNNEEEEGSLPARLKEDARSLLLQRKTDSLLNNNELKTLCIMLDQHQSPPFFGDDQLINYLDLKKVLMKSSPKCRGYFSPKLFAQLQIGDYYKRVSLSALLNYAMRKTWLHQSRIGLSLYDSTGKGYLKESDLENYILELIPTLPQLDGLEKSFHNFYVCTAVRKFLFFLDPLRTGKIRIQDILASGFLDDLLELRNEDLPKDMQDSNWFSAHSALRVYGQYLNLDKNHNGMLSKDELAGLFTGTLTNVFIERVFQECLTYEGEMDYKTYLDFILALENRHEPQALQFLFRILDIKGKGYLDAFTLHYFFRAIQDQMQKSGHEPVLFQDVQDEMFDMVKPRDPSKITLQDLIESGQGDTLINMIIDLNGFWSHENREARVVEEPTDI